MRKITLMSLMMLMCFTAYRAEAQDIVYRDTFRNGVPATTAQITRWNNFRAKLLANLAYTSVTISGQYDVTGITCNDVAITKAFAAAVRTNTAYASATTNGHVWSICNRYDGEIWIDPPSTCSGSNCPSPGYIIRPGIGTGNSNWGGINTATCGGANQWMELRFKVVPPFNWNAATVGFSKLDPCDVKQDLVATFENAGKKDIDSFQVYVKVNSTTYGPTWTKTKIATGKQATVTVYSGYTFTPSTAYTISVWTDKPNNNLDSFRGNDTIVYKFGFNGRKGTPSVNDTAVCGSQFITLKALPNQAGDSLAWFSDRGLNVQVGSGTTYKTKYLASGAKYKFFVASYNGFIKGTLSMGYRSPAYGWPSSMFDVKALNSDLTVDSLGIHIYYVNFSAGSSVPVEVYIREGSYNDAGATTTPSMWTKVYSGNVIAGGLTTRTTIPAKFELKSGVNYGVYINPTVTASNTILAQYAALTYSNSDITMSGGTLNQINFGTALTGYTLEGEIFYKKMLCKSAPDSVEANVKPAPFGAKLDAGIPWQVAPKNGGNGVLTKPHVVALGDTLAFNLQAPSGYTDAMHNSKWKVKGVTVKTLSGRTLSSYTWADPISGSSTPGRLVYTPTSAEIDSVIVMTVSMQDLGPYFCDSTIKHYVYVAPLPEPDFSRNAKICDGDPIEFINKSKILKGFIDYKWYFGDGDSSEAQDPIKQYSTYGVYYCKLNAISSIYGYVRTKIDTITVTQIPLVKFKVLNACETKAHSFVNQTTVNAGSLSYSWDFGDNTPKSTQKDPTHLYAAVGQYKVTLTASANGCSATGTKNAYVFPKPKASYSFDNTQKYCTNTPVTFNNTSTVSSGNMGVKWKFEPGQLGTIDVPMHTFKTAGTYDVKAIAITEFGCMDSMTKSLTIFEAPKVSFTNSSACDLTPTQFTNTTPDVPNTIDNYKWSFGDGNSSTALSPSHQYTQLGPKTVKLVVSTASGCADSASKNIVVGTQANVDFDAQAACSGEEVQFDNKTKFPQGDVKYKWYFGGVDSSSLADPKYTFTPANTTTYNITLKVTVDGGCESVVTKPLNILEKPNCAFTISDGWNVGSGGYGYRTVNVAAGNTTYPYYRFKFSDGGSLTSATGEYQFPYEGDFTVTLIARNSVDCECTSTQSKSIRNSVGTENLSNGEVRIYPNPSTGVVNVEALAGTEIQSVKVYNLLGGEVSVISNLTDSKGSVEFGSAANGVYLVKIATNKGTITRRVTIQH